MVQNIKSLTSDYFVAIFSYNEKSSKSTHILNLGDYVHRARPPLNELENCISNKESFLHSFLKLKPNYFLQHEIHIFRTILYIYSFELMIYFLNIDIYYHFS